MGRGQWIGLIFGTFAVFLPGNTWANAQNPPTVRVVLHDTSEASEHLLDEAAKFAGGVFDDAGIDIVMASGVLAVACPARRSEFFCVQVLLRPRHPEFAPGKRRPMGVALAADGNRAVVSVYLDAVTDVARRYGLPVGKVLGIALAHEMGHALLPPPSHSADGIMQAAWDGDDLQRASVSAIAFSTEQATLMRERLIRRAAP